MCDICGVDHPLSIGGVAPVAQFVLGLFALAFLLGILGAIFGPLVG